MRSYNYIVVGAGSAGATLGARLSENTTANVLLLDAGPDYADEAMTPADILDSRNLANLKHDWLYTASPVPGRSIPYRRGKVVGGTSAINAAAALWGREADFAKWERLGNSEWRWQDVQPYFRQLVKDPDIKATSSEENGLIPIARYAENELIPIQSAFYRACKSLGFGECRDHNECEHGGVGPWPMNRRGLQRVSTAISHLARARARPNLTIRSNCLVNRLLLEDGRAIGVELADERRAETERGERVILCAGAIGSPAILLRSGIGPKPQADQFGVRSLLDLPGVGARLWDHAAVPIRLVPKRGECEIGRDPRFQIMARLSASKSSIDDDLMLVLVSHLDLTPMPAIQAEAGVPVVAVLMVALMAPRGCGYLTLSSRDPHVQPEINLNFCAEPEDNRRLMDGVRTAWKLACSDEMTQAYDRVAGLDDVTVKSDKLLTTYIANNVGTFCHALGTAPMGPEDDAFAVTDQHCRVRGIENLWIVDASVIPAVPRVVPNLSVIMIAERAAEWLKATDRIC